MTETTSTLDDFITQTELLERYPFLTAKRLTMFKIDHFFGRGRERVYRAADVVNAISEEMGKCQNDSSNTGTNGLGKNEGETVTTDTGTTPNPDELSAQNSLRLIFSQP